MKPALEWIKSHVWIVVLTAIILVVLPTGFVFSSMWNKSIRTTREKEVNDDLAKLKQTSVAYTEQELIPGEAPIARTDAPNDKLTEWFQARRAEQSQQVERVVSLANEHNRRSHAPLVQGLFPAPTPGQGPAKAIEMARAIVPGARGKEPSAYERLLASIEAGAPPDPVQVAMILNDLKQTEIDKLTAGAKSGQEVTAEEQEQILKRLVSQRIGEYQRRSEQFSVYATMAVFTGAAPEIPKEMPSRPPQLDDCFLWQHDYWTVSDILAAVAGANTGDDGKLTPVTRSVVKRIESLELEPLSFPDAPGEGEVVANADPKAGLLPVSFAQSVTGRGATNLLYDIRKAKLTVVVSMERLPEFLSAIARTNFMTVTDLDLESVDVWRDLERGYFYGSEAVVKATLSLETVWLRSWTQPLMPAGIRSRLGIPEESPEEDGTGEAPGQDPGGDR